MYISPHRKAEKVVPDKISFDWKHYMGNESHDDYTINKCIYLKYGEDNNKFTVGFRNCTLKSYNPKTKRAVFYSKELLEVADNIICRYDEECPDYYHTEEVNYLYDIQGIIVYTEEKFTIGEKYDMVIVFRGCIETNTDRITKTRFVAKPQFVQLSEN